MAFSTTPETIEVVIKKEDGAWTVEPKVKKDNDDRFDKVKVDFEKKRKERHGKETEHSYAHNPIVFKTGDTLKFTGPTDLEFGIGAKKNPDVDEFPGAPDNPFGWTGVQIVAKNDSVSGIVNKTASGPGVKEQAFYKFHGWVLVNGEYIPVDPDGYCGS